MKKANRVSKPMPYPSKRKSSQSASLIDSTTLDVMCINKSGVCIGQPVMHVVIDSFSRLIINAYVSLDGRMQ